MSNGYLRRDEWRSWAENVDNKLDSLLTTLQAHSEQLAVFKERYDRTLRWRTWIGGIVAALITAALIHFMK